ncbi:TetR/AcrR family transcriptional regulator [Mycolicibacterium sp. 018/SC-01/001]|uniref:TetR/AcrR family transcriptional regulator n=1 Tax=Mycolicibacterium sp. 018/SC-01/001 TaxID=2592069 RepID=UPI00117FE4E7|nr:TetR/AcrR family transcriptional regulator [Mycolicibacterium sp. 018/SC-01/001]TRW88945.1 TetR/AcrR family transcriptional regulator [Mycolicibacterium sp. 018/SC-01/001]
MTDGAMLTVDRLLDGLTVSIGERGYRESTVADIVRHARTSKRTFYEHFAGKEQCLIELLRRNNADLIARIRSAVAPDDDWERQIRQAVDAYVAHIGARPAITLCWIREAPALGAASRPLHRQVMGDLTELLTTLTASPGFRRAGVRPLGDTTALILLGGLRELTAFVVEDGRDVAEIAGPAVAAATALTSQ